jgi:hypothetical protein
VPVRARSTRRTADTADLLARATASGAGADAATRQAMTE